ATAGTRHNEITEPIHFAARWFATSRPSALVRLCTKGHVSTGAEVGRGTKRHIIAWGVAAVVTTTEAGM
ncbi:MAG: hypothetical protein ACI8XD_001604, partial [Thermoproteota archaeon]